MQNCNSLAKRKICLCKLPDCSCEKCTKLGQQSKHTESLDSKPGNKSCSEESETTETSTHENCHKLFAKLKAFIFPTLSMPTFKFTPHDFSSVLCDFVGIISFFFMISIMFWLAVSQWLWCLAKKLFQAERNIKLLTLAVIILLCASITYHALIGTYHRNHDKDLAEQNSNLKPPSEERTVQRIRKHCHHKKCFLYNSKKSSDNAKPPPNKKMQQCEHKPAPSNGQALERKIPSLCDLCAEKFKTEMKVQAVLSDEEAREMYRRYKLYSVPSEMKFPPSFGHIFEAFLGIFESLSNAVNHSFF